MWGNHLLDIYQHTNFNTSFPHDLTRNPTRLIQWQYWWWFWFSSVFVLYYFLITKVILKRSLKFRPKIVTSYRSHGRWGDIIVAVIPIFWCLNILSHSTLLLRMSEFQTETNILTIRVRGRQWYWVYKLEIANFFSLSNKKILLNGGKSVSLSNYFRGGSLDVFEIHENYRQYWRNWFQNKTIFHFNSNLIKGELLSSETKLNDINTDVKNKEWSLKTTRIKNSWYKKLIESNLNTVNQKNTYNNNFDVVLSDLKLLNHNSGIKKNNINSFFFIDINKLNNEFLFNTINSGFYTINNFYMDNVFYNGFLKNKNNKLFTFNNNFFNFNNIVFVNNINNLYYFNTNEFFNKIILEIFKVNTNYITKKNINKLLSSFNVFLANKEPVKYSYDLKTKFGYLITKVDLIPICEHNVNFITKTPLLAIQPEMEYETKNLETTFKYFIVMDQHRKQLNRFFKNSNEIEFISRFNLLNNLNKQDIEFLKKKFLFCETKEYLNPLRTFDGQGKETTVFVNSPNYNNLLIKSNFSIIKTHNDVFSSKKEDLDFYSQSKYLIKDDVSAMQGNIKNKKKLIFNQRLLHTTSVLVLPTSLNITVITNSYDVIHSWFIPGLGLKMDCVPGRSTHHTLYIDHPGLYYGQCAEICGRFHHHMPIKIAALQWEHFLLWWYHHTMNLGINPLVKDFNKSSLKEFKTNKVYPVTTKFNKKRPIV